MPAMCQNNRIQWCRKRYRTGIITHISRGSESAAISGAENGIKSEFFHTFHAVPESAAISGVLNGIEPELLHTFHAVPKVPHSVVPKTVSNRNYSTHFTRFRKCRNQWCMKRYQIGIIPHISRGSRNGAIAKWFMKRY